MEQSIQTDRVADYLAELRPYLDDLDPGERAEVLDELADALREVAAENDRPLREVLGPPADYVAAYRASAGLEQRPPRSSGPLGTLTNAVRTQLWWPPVLALARLLRPAWWTLRGVTLTMLLGSALDTYVDTYVLVPFEATSFAGLVCIVAGVAASLAVGGGRQFRKGRWRVALAAANVTAVIATVGLFSAGGPLRYVDSPEEYYDGPYPVEEPVGLSGIGAGEPTVPDGEVTNIYPYTRDGEPLRDVLLFDSAGQPLTLMPEGVLETGNGGIETQYERDAADQPVTNLYPLRQYTVEYDESGGAPRRRSQPAPTVVLPPPVRDDAAESPTARTSEPATGGGDATGN